MPFVRETHISIEKIRLILPERRRCSTPNGVETRAHYFFY
jgi:hypothetical protein